MFFQSEKSEKSDEKTDESDDKKSVEKKEEKVIILLSDGFSYNNQLGARARTRRGCVAQFGR